MAKCGAWCWACNKDHMWEHESCPDCKEPIVIRHSVRCMCDAVRLSASRPAPKYCPMCEETKAQTQDPKWYPDHVNWIVCPNCEQEEEDASDNQV